MKVTIRDLFHKVLEEGDLEYQLYVVDHITGDTVKMESIEIYDDVVEIIINKEGEK